MREEEAERAQSEAAADAEARPTFELRARPRPVARFRRGVIVASTALVSAAVIGVTWMALEPAALRLRGGGEEQSEPLRKPALEALANAPASYGEIPRLGPPLPGDLGRPILEHERQGGAADAMPPAPAVVPPAPVDAAGQQSLSQAAAARRSPVAVQLAGRSAGTPGAVVPAGEAERVPGSVGEAGDATGIPPGSQQRKIDFARPVAGTANPHVPEEAPSRWTLSAGTVIAASLVTGVDSDLPGAVLAQVSENVFDSATGRTLLIPQGARLIGTYDSAVAYGQRRALLVWNRLLLPDGSSVGLDKVPGADREGYAGLADKVDSHTGRLLKGILLSTLLGVGTTAHVGGESALARTVRESLQQNGSRAADQITLRNLDVQPTIRIRPGYRLIAVLAKDLVLRPWRGVR